MGFEGAEKKFEIVSKGACLRDKGEVFWTKAAELANAKVLSQISNDKADAYLLSESSLFVSDDRVTMITCGRTSLIKAVVYVIEELGAEKINLLTYERKNEYFPHQQETDFLRDVEVLRKYYPGQALRFGSPDEHHLFLYYGEKDFKPEAEDCTVEILMYGLQQPVPRQPDLSAINALLPGFVVDDYHFDPCGYSLNALRGSDYYTIHLSPEPQSSYVSFETNVRLDGRLTALLKDLVALFRPRSFDVVYFHPEEDLQAFQIKPYIQRHFTRQGLSCGFQAGFSTYYLKTKEPMLAVPLISREAES